MAETGIPEKKPGGVTGKGFVKGDNRINRKGRPKSFDALRELGQQIAHESLTMNDGSKRTAVEVIMRKMATENPERFLEIAFGKVPNPVEVSGPDGGPIKVKVKGYGIFNPDDWDGETETESEDADGEPGEEVSD